MNNPSAAAVSSELAAAPGRPKPVAPSLRDLPEGEPPSGGSAVHALSAKVDPGEVTSVGARLVPRGAAITAIREFLTFKLGHEEYGMDILRVQEIRSYEQPTRMANAPAFIKGVVNLRGVIVPIVDMRIKFNLAQVNYDSFTVVIVLNVGKQVLGMVVDGVSDVISLSAEQLHPVPEFSSAIGSDHVLAIGSVQDRMLILLDIEKLMSSAEMGLLTQTLH